MRNMTTITGPLLRSGLVAAATMFLANAQAATFGITSAPPVAPPISPAVASTFNLSATAAFISQPDGASIYSWGYGCSASTATFKPATNAGTCTTMQLPGPTLIVNEGDTVTVTLTNNLPPAAGRTSILFPGFDVTATGGSAGLLTREAAVGGTVTYSFVANTPGTHSYYSGTQGDLQVEMGMYGALVVIPKLTGAGSLPKNYVKAANSPDTCFAPGAKVPLKAGEDDQRLSVAAYDHPAACYDREYLFQFSELDPVIHRQAEEQSGVSCAISTGCMTVATEPYHPTYFMINGRSFPDDTDPSYAAQYPHQPYNGNPHLHPGELVLLRIVGQGRMQHPFHEHANHVRVLARDGNLLLNANGNLSGPLMFTTSTTPGLAMDAIFQWTGKGLNWDVFGHGKKNGVAVVTNDDSDHCVPDANGYYTVASGASGDAPNYYEWCGDHGKSLESKPFGNVGDDGPITLPDPNIVANGAWYGGSPYFGPEATVRAVGATPIPPSGTVANDPGGEAGFAYMWHSHNEREITTNNIFPGGMMMMMLVDPWVYTIDEAK
jgi:FtsP/CotA-like multicopper oxidase with cupredoxin domain